MIRTFGWEFGVADLTAQRVTQVLVAGFGAIALFRTSLFNVTTENQVIGIGPSIVLNVILTAADRAVDRKLAKRRSERVAKIMDGVPFSKAANPLLEYCLELMQNAQPADRLAVSTRINSLKEGPNKEIPDSVKSYILGLSLLNIVGVDVLEDAVNRIKPHTGS